MLLKVVVIVPLSVRRQHVSWLTVVAEPILGWMFHDKPTPPAFMSFEHAELMQSHHQMWWAVRQHVLQHGPLFPVSRMRNAIGALHGKIMDGLDVDGASPAGESATACLGFKHWESAVLVSTLYQGSIHNAVRLLRLFKCRQWLEDDKWRHGGWLGFLSRVQSVFSTNEVLESMAKAILGRYGHRPTTLRSDRACATPGVAACTGNVGPGGTRAAAEAAVATTAAAATIAAAPGAGASGGFGASGTGGGGASTASGAASGGSSGATFGGAFGAASGATIGADIGAGAGAGAGAGTGAGTGAGAGAGAGVGADAGAGAGSDDDVVSFRDRVHAASAKARQTLLLSEEGIRFRQSNRIAHRVLSTHSRGLCSFCHYTEQLPLTVEQQQELDAAPWQERHNKRRRLMRRRRRGHGGSSMWKCEDCQVFLCMDSTRGSRACHVRWHNGEQRHTAPS